MRRAGANPTDVEVTDIINKVDNCTVLFCTVLYCTVQGGQRDRGAGLRPVLLRDAGQEQERGSGEQLQGDFPSVQQG